jgi:hypothetical protein
VLFIAEETVRAHVKLALRHRGTHSREELFKLRGAASKSATVRLGRRRVEPFLERWWSRAHEVAEKLAGAGEAAHA